MDNNKEIQLIFVRNYQIGTRNTSQRKLCINTTLVKKIILSAKHVLGIGYLPESSGTGRLVALLDYRGDPMITKEEIAGIATKSVAEEQGEKSRPGESSRQLKPSCCTDRQHNWSLGITQCLCRHGG